MTESAYYFVVLYDRDMVVVLRVLSDNICKIIIGRTNHQFAMRKVCESWGASDEVDDSFEVCEGFVVEGQVYFSLTLMMDEEISDFAKIFELVAVVSHSWCERVVAVGDFVDFFVVWQKFVRPNDRIELFVEYIELSEKVCYHSTVRDKSRLSIVIVGYFCKK